MILLWTAVAFFGVCAYLTVGVWCADSLHPGQRKWWLACLSWPLVLAAVTLMIPLFLIQMAYMEIAGSIWRRRR